MGGIRFRKMHGLGNDFVIVDGRDKPWRVRSEQVSRIAHRTRGVGCDQLLIIQPSAKADAFMRVFNADGSESGACGNGARCVARFLLEEKAADEVAIDTAGGLLHGWRDGAEFTIDMGMPRFRWDEIPLASPMDTLALRLSLGPLAHPVALNVGNPHVVFLVPDAAAVPLATLGPKLERHPLFPERANIGVVEVRDRRTLRARVWERGAGLTAACGSGACAALVAAARRDLCEREADVWLDGGRLSIAWTERSRILMTGPAVLSYTGVLAPELLADSG